MGSVYFSTLFSKGSLGSYFAGFAADSQEIGVSHEQASDQTRFTYQKLENDPSEAEMVENFDNRQRATFSDPRKARSYSTANGVETDVCESLKNLSTLEGLADVRPHIKAVTEALGKAFAALDALNEFGPKQLTDQLAELECDANEEKECENPLAKCFNSCADAEAAITALYNRSLFVDNAEDNLLSCLDSLQERFSAVPMQLSRVIEGLKGTQGNGSSKLSTILAHQGDADVGGTEEVENFMKTLVDIGTQIDDLDEDNVQKTAEKLDDLVRAALQQLEKHPLPSAELTQTFRERLEGLNLRLAERKTLLNDIGRGELQLTGTEELYLRSAAFLRRIFEDDQFSVSWYATALKNDVSEEIIDMRHAPDKMKEVDDDSLDRNLGGGCFSTVFKESFKGDGSILGSHDMVSKNLGMLQRMQNEYVKDKDSHLSFLGVDPSKVLYTNYYSWKSSYKMTGTCPIVSCTVGQGYGGSPGQNFAILMERAPGTTLKKIAEEEDVQDVEEMKLFNDLDSKDKLPLIGQLLEQASDLDISDWFSGQMDRHASNLMVGFSREGDGTVSATLRGIDNDLSFMNNRTGLRRMRLSEKEFANMVELWNGLEEGGGRRKDWPYKDIPQDGGTTKVPKALSGWMKSMTIDGQKYVEIDLDKAPDEYKGGFYGSFVMNSCRKPSFVSKKTYDKIMALDKELKKAGKNLSGDKLRARQYEILGLGPQLGDKALSAALSRFGEIVAHLNKLKKSGCVISDFKNVGSILKAVAASSRSVSALAEGYRKKEREQQKKQGKKDVAGWSTEQSTLVAQMGDTAWMVWTALGVDAKDIFATSSKAKQG